MGSTPLEYCWFIYKIGARTGRLTGQFETYAHSLDGCRPGDFQHDAKLEEKSGWRSIIKASTPRLTTVPADR